MTRAFSDLHLRAYLLGGLGPDESEAIEDGFFTSESVFRRLEMVEGELIDDFAAGRLSPDERLAVEAALNGSAEGEARIRFSRALQATSKPPRAQAWAKQARQLLSRGRAWWTSHPHYWAPMACASVLLLFWIVPIPSSPHLPRLRLEVSQVRAGTETPELERPRRDLEIEVGLHPAEPGLAFEVSVVRAGHTVGTLSVQRSLPGEVLQFRLPSDWLEPGRLQLELRTQGEEAPIAYFPLRISDSSKK